MKRGSPWRAFAGLVLLWAHGACSFSAPLEGAGDASSGNDAPPAVMCGDLTCDPHASCLEGPARCVCAQGYEGDGATCADVDECATGNGGCPAACANSDGGFTCYAPRTCADVEAMVPDWAGGSVTLYVGGDPAKPWTAHCAANREYLSLARDNFSTYKRGSDVRTTFTKIRIDPLTLLVDIADQTFSTSTGTLNHDSTVVTSMPYAVAMDCLGPNSAEGRARIDLEGTPFVVVNNQFKVVGAVANGSVMVTGNGRRLDVTGGGNCGWNAPDGTPFNPFNTIASSPILQLSYP